VRSGAARQRLPATLAAAREKAVKLRLVACLLHRERSGRGRDSMRGPVYLAHLNEAAQALSEVIEIYCLVDGKMNLIPRHELAGAVFQDGGNILRSAGGALYRCLTVRRGQAIAAITVLASNQ